MANKVLVFDFGNVIGMFSHLKAAGQMAKHCTKNIETIRTVLFDETIENELEKGNLSPEQYRKIVRDSLHINCQDHEFDHAFSDMFAPNEAVCNIIPTLAKSHRLILLSNTNWFHANRFLAQFNQILCHFDSLILSHEVRCRKPARQIYEILNEKTNTKPSECLFVDDLHANIQTAKDCGWDGIVYHQEMNLEKELASKGISF
ncbi:MAG: HAD family phosphatase [Planctomycetes bacterium]|nr:HAD family phosphatase [Planctomycetota bacterium]NBY03135.1 HAD family phosphatase [Planctomycetota bacterium]